MSTVHTFSGADDVWFSLRGTTYQNNSLVALEDIGEGSDALLCRTNLTDCCRPSYDYTGFIWLYPPSSWFFPNGILVPSPGEQWDFYRTRGQMMVLLNRRRGGVGGIYSCEIPDSMNVIRTIYIGVYAGNTGEFYICTIHCSAIVVHVYTTLLMLWKSKILLPPKI